MKNIFSELFRSALTLSIFLMLFMFSSCIQGPGVENGTSPYESRSLIKVLDPETGGERVLGVGMYPRIASVTDKVFFSDADGLCCINQDSTEFTRIIKGGPYLQTYNISPDGKKVVVMLVESSGTNSWGNNIYIVNADGTGLTKIYNMPPPYDPSPVFSPRMDKIVFTNSKDIASIDLQGNNFKIIKAKTDTSYYQYIHFLPDDNDRLVYLELVQDKNQNTIGKYLKVYSISTGKETLVGKYDSGFDFEFSENGKMLITYSSGAWHTGIFDITKNFAFTDILKGYAWNSISGDGQKVVSSKLTSLLLMNSDGTNSKTVLTLNDSLQAVYPKISRNGRFIVYQYNFLVSKY